MSALNSLLDQGATILTASRRLAHALRLQYAEYAQSKGLTVWRTPLILPWSAWLRLQWQENRAHAFEAQAVRLLTAAQTRVLWDDIIAASPVGGELLNPSSAARVAANSWRRLHDYLIPLQTLADASTPEAQALHGWAGEFMRRCDELQAFDEARLMEWAHRVQLAPSEQVAFAGFDDMPPAMKRLADSWRTRGVLIELPQQPAATTDVTVINAPDAQGEIELAARWARALLESRDVRIGVVVADLQHRQHGVRRAFENVFAPGMRSANGAATPMPVVIAASQPLTAYPVVDAALLLLDLLRGNARSTVVGRILRSPFVAGGTAERDSRALADFRLRDEQRDRWDWFELERWAGMTGCHQLQIAAREVSAAIRAGISRASPSTWAERFHQCLRLAGWPGERTLTSVEHQTMLKFQSALADFGGLDAVLGELMLSDALARLKELLHDTPFEPEAETAAVTVIDAATVAGMQFDAIWVTGLDATKAPPPATPDPLIPLQAQRAAGVPEASPEGAFRLATIQLQRLVGSAATALLSWPERDGDAHLQPSPLLITWQRRQLEEIPQAHTRSLPTSLFAARPVLSTCPDDRAPAVAAEHASGGAMILELQSRCPFRSQAQLRLHARPLPRVSLGIEPRERGTLLHRVLADIWNELKEQRVLLQMDAATLSGMIRTFAERHAAQTLRPATRLRRRLVALEIESVIAQTMTLLAIERERAPFIVRIAEQAEQFSIGGLRIRLQPDRVDELADGSQILLDYKLGDSYKPRQWFDAWPGRPRRPQLPVYALAHAERASALAFIILAPGAVEFRGWSRDFGVGPGIIGYPPKRLPPNAPYEWPALMQYWRHTLTRLAGEFIAGHAVVDPLPLECQTCHLSSLCRIHERPLLAVDPEESVTAQEGGADE